MQRPCPETNVLREGKQSVCETAGSHKPEVGYQIFRCLPMAWRQQRGLEKAGLCSTARWGKLRPSGCPWLNPDAEPIPFPALTHSHRKIRRGAAPCKTEQCLHSAMQPQLPGSLPQGEQLVHPLTGTGLKGLPGLQSPVPTHKISFQEAIEIHTPVTPLTAGHNILPIFHARHRASIRNQETTTTCP